MPERQNITKNIGWLALGNILVKPIWFLFLLLTVRVLGADDFGKYMLAISFASVASVIFEGGVDILTIRELSSEPEKYETFFGHTAVLKLAAGVLAGSAAIVVSFILRMQWEMIVLVILASAYSVFNTLLLHFRSVFRAFEVMKYEAISIVMEKLSVIVLCGAVLLAHMGVRAFMAGYLLAYCLTGLITFMLVLSKVGIPSLRPSVSYMWSRVLKPALPFAVLNIFTIIYFRSGTLMIGALTGREEIVGYYNAGYRLVESFMLFPTIIIAPLYPVISRNREDVDAVRSVLLDAARALLVISVSISFPIYLFRDQLTLLLFGTGYKLATTFVGVLALTMIPISLNFVAGTLVAALGRQAKSNIFVLVVTLMNLLLNYVLIKAWGGEGAAVTTLLTEALLVIFNLGIVRDYIPWRSLIRVLYRAFVPALLGWALLLTSVGKLSFTVQIVAVLVMMLTGYFLLRLVTFDDLKRLAHTR
ncbi:MAG: flippase [Bacteroidetes bacterium]|nr:flippase [Bacteroidota bacterium]MCL5738968.1 flippase [Bacteroidota bacterium]